MTAGKYSTAKARHCDISGLQARQFAAADFGSFHYILAMDESNLADLQALCPGDYSGHLGLFLPFAGAEAPREVPDPYYGGDAGFDEVLDLVELASIGLLGAIRDEHPLPDAYLP